MDDLLTPPAERDLPPGRAARMRAGLLTAAGGQAPRPRVSRRLLATVAAVVVLIAAGAVTLEVRQEQRTQVLAMSPGELTPSLRQATRQCFKWRDADAARSDPAERVDVTPADIAVAARQGAETAILFLTDAGYAACGVTDKRGEEVSGSFGGERWPHRDWLPGPVQVLDLSSTEFWGGAVAVLGRVSARVDRLVLEHGSGRTTTARLRNGAFGLLTTTADVRRSAELVSYDATGTEIDRRPLFTATGELPGCWTDPAGTVIYGSPGPACTPADPWTR